MIGGSILRCTLAHLRRFIHKDDIEFASLALEVTAHSSAQSAAHHLNTRSALSGTNALTSSLRGQPLPCQIFSSGYHVPLQYAH